MGCNCNNERNNQRNDERNDERNNNRNNRRNNEVTFNAKITVDKEEFCRAVDRCDDERRDNFNRRSDRWWNF
ncbi:hypothetical protein [Bacillus sp. AFS053548]|uniref:hypothetical protein n=1 Tax=Bacillus sp. AFS053548 TaxID=2033505 RepID=UPI000BFBFE29|nr:hypothetical protein [Bacillus sp. AFS053548]PGM57034.1 hypothetical protein CN946_08800 [Bacillus sp. AFS053548]